jgi:hypothetical protein
LNQYKHVYGGEFDYLLARAILSAGHGKHREAMAHLRSARYHIPDDLAIRPLYPWYQLIETCEWLYQDTNYSEYKDFAVQLAKIQERIKPMMGWTYAVEAKYAGSEPDRLRALALTLYLDERSERISKFTDQEKSKAREWLEQNNPFLPKNSVSEKSKI